MGRGRKKTMCGVLNDAVKSRANLLRMHRREMKTIQELKKDFSNIVIPFPNLLNSSFQSRGFHFMWHPETAEQAKEVRSEVGKLFGILSWERRVCSYDGTVSYCARYLTHEFEIANGELAPGCEIIKVEEQVTRVRYKSTCENKETAAA
jgi:hypothetical protein